jgi:hypothetical protein
MGYMNNKEINKKFKDESKLKIYDNEENIILENEFLKATFSKKKLTFSLYDKSVERIVINDGNQFVIHEGF